MFYYLEMYSGSALTFEKKSGVHMEEKPECQAWQDQARTFGLGGSKDQ